MNHLIKKTGKIIAALLVLVILLSVLLTAIVDINQYKSEIIHLVKQETGLNLEINGDMQLTVFSGLKFNAKNIKLSLGDELIADIEFLRLGLSAYSLYSGEAKINLVELRLKTLNIFRDKNNQFNFLPLYHNQLSDKQIKAKKDPVESLYKETLAIKSIVLKELKLSIEKFQYLDDLESVSIKLEQLEASLSQLPIIDNYELVIDDPQILTAYNYSAELAVKKGLVNQFQIADLALKFKAKKGAFAVDTMVFQLLEEGTEHAPPPLVINADGKLTVNINYLTPQGSVEALWSKPDIIKVSLFDFNLSEIKINKQHFQLATQQTHLTFEEVSIFSASQYALDNLLIKSLNFESKKVDVNVADVGDYHFNQLVIQLANIPFIHEAKFLSFLSETFMRKFAENGHIEFLSDSLSHRSQKLEKIKLSLTGKNQQISLNNISFQALRSEARAEGSLQFSTLKKNQAEKWQLKIKSEKLYLKPLSALFNLPGQLDGFITLDTQLSGLFQKSKFAIVSGNVKTRARDILVGGIDIDKVLDNFQKSQSVGLLDVGAVALLGPAGVLVSKGSDYQSLLKSLDNKGNSKIKQLNSEISFSDGIAVMKDVAFATEKNRLAIKGKINTKSRTFIDFEVATIDNAGCPIYQEEMRGSIESPTVKKVSFLVSGVVNPLSSILSKVTKPITSGCKDVFYSGIVQAPLK